MIMNSESTKDIQPRKDFYSKELNLDRMNKVLEYVISTLTLQEILKMIREISYDMVCYYDEDAKGIIYNGEYNNNHRWQAFQLQRLLSTACDLFEQSVVGHREFDDKYLSKWLGSGVMERKIAELEEEIRLLKEEKEF